MPTGDRLRAACGILLALLPCAAAWAGPIDPPTVILRPISPTERQARGTSITLEQSTVTLALSNMPKKDVQSQVVLYLPEDWKSAIVQKGGKARVPLTLHFHGATWWAIEEHARRGAKHPLIACYFGEGASMYQKPLQQPGKLNSMISTATTVSTSLASLKELEFGPIELQSFSAGYGAVREILKDTSATQKVSRLILADSLYSTLTTGSLHPTRSVHELDDKGTSVTHPAGPQDDQMAGFVAFAKEAASGKKEMLVAHSTIHTASYCSTLDTARYLVSALGEKPDAVTTGSVRSADAGLSFPLTARTDRKDLHIWQYDGDSPQAHMAIARTIADFHKALDEAESKK